MFETERCTVIRLQESDYSDVEKIYANPEVRKFLGGIRNEDLIKGIVEEMLTPSQESFHWIVREKQAESMIGLVSLDLHHEVSYQILPCWWEKRCLGAAMDSTRSKYGSTSILSAVSYTHAGTAVQRSTLLGRHKK